jgi:hypothetical protein
MQNNFTHITFVYDPIAMRKTEYQLQKSETCKSHNLKLSKLMHIASEFIILI